MRVLRSLGLALIIALALVDGSQVVAASAVQNGNCDLLDFGGGGVDAWFTFDCRLPYPENEEHWSSYEEDISGGMQEFCRWAGWDWADVSTLQYWPTEDPYHNGGEPTLHDQDFVWTSITCKFFLPPGGGQPLP